MNMLRKFMSEERGQDMVEYALLLGFVAVVAAAVITTVGADVKTVWTVTSNHMANAAVSAGK